MGWLSTHVLDTANGRPAAEMTVMLWQVAELSEKDEQSLVSAFKLRENYHHIKTVQTNQDGRTDVPLLENEDFQQGTYEIVFAVGDYFSQVMGYHAASLPKSLPFLDLVPIRFSVADANTHYHVPLLVSPWSYSTYRGS